MKGPVSNPIPKPFLRGSEIWVELRRPARVVRERFGQARVMTITPDFAFSQAHDPRSPRMQYDPHQAPKLRSR